jgi:hypothetical protein
MLTKSLVRWKGLFDQIISCHVILGFVSRFRGLAFLFVMWHVSEVYTHVGFLLHYTDILYEQHY